MIFSPLKKRFTMNYKAQSQGNLQAFPVPSSDDHYRVDGLSKREYFAAMAMQGMLSGRYPWGIIISETARLSVEFADALLNELHPQGTSTDFDEE
jgi:hypothetical protein